MMNREPQRWGDWWVALTLAWLATAVLLLLGTRLSSYLGQKGLLAMERLTGMLLVAMAIQMFLSGIERYFGLVQKANAVM